MEGEELEWLITFCDKRCFRGAALITFRANDLTIGGFVRLEISSLKFFRERERGREKID